MSQTAYVGPVANAGAGDIGILTGSAVTFIVYLALRSLEQSLYRR